jgi:hypothetical protein
MDRGNFSTISGGKGRGVTEVFIEVEHTLTEDGSDEKTVVI